MDRQATFLLALGLLITAAAFVSVSGWILFLRDRRADRAGSTAAGASDTVERHEDVEEH
jgi:hypothetical protein